MNRRISHIMESLDDWPDARQRKELCTKLRHYRSYLDVAPARPPVQRNWYKCPYCKEGYVALDVIPKEW